MSKDKSRSRRELVEVAQTAFAKLQTELLEALGDRDVCMEAVYMMIALSDASNGPQIKAMFNEMKKWLSTSGLQALELLLKRPPKTF